MKKVAIIIACRNEENYIGKAIKSISNLDISKDEFEVVVVDGMSTDRTRNILQELVSQYSWLRVIDNEKQKTPYAFNLGIKNTDSKYVMIMGARHIIYPNNLLESIKKLEGNKEVACVGGSVVNLYENKISEIISKSQASKFGVGSSNFRTLKKETFVDTVGTPFFRRSIFDEIGYFDEKLTRNQDDDFSYRLLENGYKILFTPNVRIDYYVRASFTKLFNQYKQYGYWKIFVNKKHKTITTLRQIFPLLFVLSLFVLPALGLVSKFFLNLFLIEILFYIALLIINAFKESREIIKIFQISFACFILHFSYGIGYLKGIIDFIFLDRKPQNEFEKLTR